MRNGVVQLVCKCEVGVDRRLSNATLGQKEVKSLSFRRDFNLSPFRLVHLWRLNYDCVAICLRKENAAAATQVHHGRTVPILF